jgi:hypothetical protein
MEPLVHDTALVVGQGLGVVATAIIVGQMLFYRKNAGRTTKNRAKPIMLWYKAMLLRLSSKILEKQPVPIKYETNYTASID